MQIKYTIQSSVAAAEPNFDCKSGGKVNPKPARLINR